MPDNKAPNILYGALLFYGRLIVLMLTTAEPVA
jgi:hypothetical protein